MGEALSATAHAHFFAGQYAEACLWAERTRLESPNVLGGLRVLAASYTLAGRSDRARAAVGQLLQIDPARRISNLWSGGLTGILNTSLGTLRLCDKPDYPRINSCEVRPRRNLRVLTL